MRALFESMPLGPGQDLLLLYRVRSASEVLFRVELDALARRQGARVHFLFGDAGPFTPHLFRRLVPDLAARDVFLCGPPAMAAAARRAMKQVGLPDQLLHEERFDL
jgi:ferredoxin-NADP reductase